MAASTGFIPYYVLDSYYRECSRGDVDDEWVCSSWEPRNSPVIRYLEGYVEGESIYATAWILNANNGRWGFVVSHSYAQQRYSSPFAQFTSTEYSNGEYHVTVLTVSTNHSLEAFSYFLKDEAGSTNEFGEITMQNLSGNVVGIDASYGDKCGENCDDDLLSRSDAVDDVMMVPIIQWRSTTMRATATCRLAITLPCEARAILLMAPLVMTGRLRSRTIITAILSAASGSVKTPYL